MIKIFFHNVQIIYSLIARGLKFPVKTNVLFNILYFYEFPVGSYDNYIYECTASLSVFIHTEGMSVVSAADIARDGIKTRQAPLHTWISGGAVAGVSVDIALYPLDTLKTRLQSQSGFRESGGFRGIYKGVAFTCLLSPVSSGLFFGTYILVKQTLTGENEDQRMYPFIHMFSSSVAQLVSSVVDVPMEVIRQRRQTSKENLSCLRIAELAVKREGIIGLYRGFAVTMLRDLPFVMIEYSFWEWLRNQWRCKVDRDLKTVEASVCGALACAVATTITTPLDVVQTHIILADASGKLHSSPSILLKIGTIYQQHGMAKLFAGFIPRISVALVGGAMFFGIFDLYCKYSFYKTNVLVQTLYFFLKEPLCIVLRAVVTIMCLLMSINHPLEIPTVMIRMNK